MSTPNFGTPNFDLPLICGGLDYEEKKKQYEEETGEEYSEDAFYNDTYWEAKDIQEELEEFNKELKHFEVEIEDGYYQGYMFNAKQTDDYWDYYDLANMTDEDAEYYYGDTKANVIAEYEDDMKKIKDYFSQLKERGFYELIRTAIFSNGEAIYKRVA